MRRFGDEQKRSEPSLLNEHHEVLMTPEKQPLGGRLRTGGTRDVDPLPLHYKGALAHLAVNRSDVFAQ